MAFDGAGTFLRLYNWMVDATNNVKIRADRHDAEDNNFAAGLSNCICKDGQTAITQNIPWNSRRITSLADPVNAQDAATMAYADTKVAKAGDGTITGNLTVTGTITSTGDITTSGMVTANGYRTRYGTAGAVGNNWFNFWWDGNLSAFIDGTNLGPLATQAFANTAATNAANTRLPLTGGTISGNLQVTGEIGANANIYRFGAVGSSAGYIQWQGGNTYVLGGAGTIWHSGNLNPSTGLVKNARLAFAADTTTLGFTEGISEPYPGSVCTGFYTHYAGGSPYMVGMRFRWLQLTNDGTNYFTVGTA